MHALLTNSLRQLRRCLRPSIAPHAQPTLHPSIDYRTSTGRLVTSGPNLQGLPHVSDSSAVFINLRDVLIARDGHSFVAVDYSQVCSYFCKGVICIGAMFAGMRRLN